MSHTATVEVKVKKPHIIKQVIENMGGTYLGVGTHKLYSQSITGVGAKLPDWRYPVIIEEDGTLKYDNYNGNWGSQETLDTLIQDYTIAAIKEEAVWQNLSIDEIQLEDGSIKLTLNDYREA